jgi:hypothetical protein
VPCVRRAYACGDTEEWRGTAAQALSGPGPVVVRLKLAAQAGERAPTAMQPVQEQIARLRQVLEAERLTTIDQAS